MTGKTLTDAQARLVNAITWRVMRTLTAWVFVMFCGMWVAQWVLNAAGIGLDSTDIDGAHRSGMKIRTDAKTGLQYLATAGGGLTPRLGIDGQQMRGGE